MSKNVMLPHRDPLDEARRYLMLRGVAHSDLITGDHVAVLLVEYTTAMVQHCEQILKLLDDWNATQLTPTTIIPKPKGL